MLLIFFDVRCVFFSNNTRRIVWAVWPRLFAGAWKGVAWIGYMQVCSHKTYTVPIKPQVVIKDDQARQQVHVEASVCMFVWFNSSVWASIFSCHRCSFIACIFILLPELINYLLCAWSATALFFNFISWAQLILHRQLITPATLELARISWRFVVLAIIIMSNSYRESVCSASFRSAQCYNWASKLI